MLSKGVEALILSIDTVTSRGLPAIVSVARDNFTPIYYPSLGGVSSDATISAGYFQQEIQGLNIGRMVSAALRGELDVASTAIDAIGADHVGVGVNLDEAETLEIEIAEEILESADVILGGGQFRLSDRLTDSTTSFREHFENEDRVADDRAYLESLHCTAEMIAEQQAALAAAEG